MVSLSTPLPRSPTPPSCRRLTTSIGLLCSHLVIADGSSCIKIRCYSACVTWKSIERPMISTTRVTEERLLILHRMSSVKKTELQSLSQIVKCGNFWCTALMQLSVLGVDKYSICNQVNCTKFTCNMILCVTDFYFFKLVI